jgi:hypothetical protein
VGYRWHSHCQITQVSPTIVEEVLFQIERDR